MSTKSILLLCDSLPGALTSTGAMIDSLQQELVRRGHQVELAGMGSEEVVKSYRWAVHAAWLKSGRLVVRAMTEFLVSLWLALRLLAALATGRLKRPELVVLFTPSLFLCLTAYALKVATSCRVYMVQRDIVPDWLVASGRAKPGPAVAILFALKNFSLRHADRIGIECEENLQFFPKQFHSKIEVLHNWRDFDNGVHLEEPESDEVVFIYGGRVGQVQGFDRFLRPFVELAHPRARLRIHCDERGKAEIDAMGLSPDAMKRIEILPMLQEREFLAQAAKAWFGIVTLSPDMQTHNLPGKMLAYLAAGIPVLAFGPRNAALGQVIRQLDIGRYMDAANESASIQVLREVIENPSSRIGTRPALIDARKVFSPASAADIILACAR